jgi:hypothetical protein
MALLLALLLVVVLFGLGFAVKALWIIAVVALIAWLVGFVAHSAEGRWYRW